MAINPAPALETTTALEVLAASVAGEGVANGIVESILPSFAVPLANGMLSIAIGTGGHMARQVAWTCSGLRDVDWAKHASTAVSTATAAARVARAAIVTHAPESVASLAIATDRPNRVPFFQAATHEQRLEIANTLLQKYPNACPVIIERARGSSLPELKRRKFLVPTSSTNAKFAFTIRRHLNVCANKGVFLYHATTSAALSPPHGTVVEFYERYRSDDGFLYLMYIEENVFG